LPDHLIQSKPIIVELVYHPRDTALAEQARSNQCPLIEGVEILLEQGLRQYKIFSAGFDAPRKEIVQAFIESYSGGALKKDVPHSFRNS
jgi:shikimate 5-dehydrogenase